MATTAMPPFLSASEIERRAQELRTRTEQTVVPIDVVLIAQHLGIGVFNVRFKRDDIAGMLEVKDGTTEIYVNASDRQERQRFTVAHELGHHALHCDARKQFVDPYTNMFRMDADDDDPVTKRQEIQANMFAAALLMPRHDLEEALENTADLWQLAGMFMVSRRAIGYRIANLGIEA